MARGDDLVFIMNTLVYYICYLDVHITSSIELLWTKPRAFLSRYPGIEISVTI